MDISIQINDKALTDALQKAAREVRDMRPLLNSIGDTVLLQTSERFTSEGPAPDGKPWEPLKAATLKRKQHHKILTERQTLRETIRYQLVDQNTVAIGSKLPYARIHQLGGVIKHNPRSELFVRNRKKGRFAKGITRGRGFTFKGHETRIPARPYLGLSAENSREIMRIVEDFAKATTKKLEGK
jgi:phage virion morphogenesis protein